MVDILVGYAQRMARYNRWQNENLYGAADKLSEASRRAERGAFFGGIHGTLSHLLWGDKTWMHRFSPTLAPPAPPRPPARDFSGLWPVWSQLVRERQAFDAVIGQWADTLDPRWLEGMLTWYSGMARREVSAPVSILVTHFFNHQTHHRGQVHCLLTQAGVQLPGADLPLMV